MRYWRRSRATGLAGEERWGCSFFVWGMKKWEVGFVFYKGFVA